jgi:hypothetical protein
MSFPLYVKWLSLLLMLASVWSANLYFVNCFVSVRARCPPQGLEPYHKSGSFLSTENDLVRLVSCLPAFFYLYFSNYVKTLVLISIFIFKITVLVGCLKG